MTTAVYLLTYLSCGLYSCDHRYAVHQTEAECQIALDEWENHIQIWPFSMSHKGYCTMKHLTEQDVATYLRRRMP